ncbi:MAG TPA: 2-amino-4-ketopentanoate thiolase [Clostridiales bacterium UBA8153]|nr:2-amino-4-ketopentanoate thiolase [Clostridiales bacterium UBA8153]
MKERAYPGDWVRIHKVVLAAGARAPAVPEDTARVPLEMWVNGFCDHEAGMGQPVTIKTAAGRTLAGILVAIEPSYGHGFGRPVPELLAVAAGLRRRYRPGRGEHE